MPFNPAILRLVCIATSIVFNVVLAAISLNNLANGLAQDTYVDANYLLSIISIISILVVGVITTLDVRHKSWMAYKLSFELCWVVLILIFQFITSIVISADQTSKLCRTGSFKQLYPKHNPCPAHSAALAFDWMAVIFASLHLGLIIQEILRLMTSTGLSFIAILQSPTDELLDLSSSESSDPEKNVRVTHLTLTTSSSTGSSQSDSQSGGRKHRPPPLDLSKISSLPVYEAHAKARAAAAREEELPTNPPHARTRSDGRDINLVRQSTRPLDRHQVSTQMMLQNMREATNATNTRIQEQKLHPYARQRSASISTSSPWTPPADWENDGKSNTGSVGHRTRSMKRQWQSAESLPSAGQLEKPLPSVLNRPDPRIRKPSNPDEFQTSGGFWHVRDD